MTIPIPEQETTFVCSPERFQQLADVLANKSGKEPLPGRFRALFSLRAVDTDEAVHAISVAFNDPSALLKHELAYVLGQMQRTSAIPLLAAVLEDTTENPMVRHEAAEALGAIGDASALPILRRFISEEQETEQVVRETCEIAIDLLTRQESEERDEQGGLVFGSVDPARPLVKHQGKTIDELQQQLMDPGKSLYERYQAMFALRNRAAGKEAEAAVLALCTGFFAESALFRHEIAYVLGQLQHPASIPALKQQLENMTDLPMVRHECAEALGSIATPDCLAILEQCEKDEEIVVRESCIVARDMYEYENSTELQFYPVE